MSGKPIEEAKAKERMLSGKVDPVQNSSQGKTRDTIADLAGVSHDTIRKVEAIKETAAPEGGFFVGADGYFHLKKPAAYHAFTVILKPCCKHCNLLIIWWAVGVSNT